MPPIKLRIDTPCTESWEAMSLQAEGRHCASCQKIVRDFTQFSDAELVAWFEQSSGRTCGRLRTDQMNKLLDVNRVERSGTSWLHWIVALMFGWQSAKGQSAPPVHKLPTAKPAATVALTKPASQQTQQQRKADDDPVVFTINGRVTDMSGVPLPGVTVSFKAMTEGCTTDKEGYFRLAVRESDQTLIIRKLVVSYVGFKFKEVLVSTNEPPSIELSVQLVDDDALLGEVIYVPDRRAGSSKRTSYKW